MASSAQMANVSTELFAAIRKTTVATVRTKTLAQKSATITWLRVVTQSRVQTIRANTDH